MHSLKNEKKIKNLKTVVLDSYALIAYFEKAKDWEIVSGVLEEAAAENCRVFLSIVNWGEIYYTILREYGRNYKDEIMTLLQNMPVEIIPADEVLTARAAEIKAKGGMSYSDCFAAALAMLEKAELITGDRDFKKLENEIKIKWMK